VLGHGVYNRPISLVAISESIASFVDGWRHSGMSAVHFLFWSRTGNAWWKRCSLSDRIWRHLMRQQQQQPHCGHATRVLSSDQPDYGFLNYSRRSAFIVAYTQSFLGSAQYDKLSWPKNVKYNNDYSVQNDAVTVQMREESESGIKKWKEMWFKTTAEDAEGQQWCAMEDWQTVPQTSGCDSGQTSTSNVQRRLWGRTQSSSDFSVCGINKIQRRWKLLWMLQYK